MRCTHLKKLSFALAIVLLIASAAMIFAACNKPQNTDGRISVTFHLNDGSNSQETKLMSPDEMPYTPERTGYAFDGWTLDSKGTQPYQTLKDNMSLYAQWTALTFTVSFYIGEELLSVKTVSYGEAAAPPTYEKCEQYLPNGKVLDSWIGGDYQHVTQSLNIVAVIADADSHAVFMSDKSANAQEIAAYAGKSGRPLPSPATPSRNGFVFSCWKTDSGNEYSGTSVFGGDVTYYAYWAPAEPAIPTVNGAKSITYGEALSLTSASAQPYADITYTYQWKNGLHVSSQEKTLKIERPAAGEYIYTLHITATSSINGYAESAKTTFDVAVTVQKATLTASVKDITLTYGDALPTLFDLTYMGFVFDDTDTAVTSVAVGSTTHSADSSVGRYYATLNFSSDNYNVVGEDGEEVAFDILVQKKTVTVSQALSKTYDGNMAYGTFVTEGLIDGHILYFTAQTHSAAAGSYVYPETISVYNITVLDKNHGSKIVTADYSIQFDVRADISPAEIKYAPPAAVTYDGQAHEAGVTLLTSLCTAEYLDGETYSKTAPTFTDAGKYTVNVRISRQNYATVTAEYEFVINSGAAVPSPTKPLLVINLGGDFEINYGDEMPTYTVSSVDGLIDGDSFETAVQGQSSMTVFCGYEQRRTAGKFALVIGGLTSSKYEITTNNFLTVNKAVLTLNVTEHAPIVFGDKVPTDFAFSASGFVSGDTDALLEGMTAETTYTQGAAVGSYSVFVNPNGTTLENYSLQTSPSQLLVTKATPIIEAEKSVFELDYIGRSYDFKAEINPNSTNIDSGAQLTLDIPTGKDGGIYAVTVTSPETANFNSATLAVTVKICAAKLGRSYFTVEDALERGGNILLIGSAFISHTVTVKSGTTLTLPCREDGTLSGFSDIKYHTMLRYLDPRTEHLLYSLTVKENVTLTVYGTLAIGGMIGQNGGAFEGHTTGMHSIVELSDNAKIEVESGGKVDCNGGFIVGNGTLTVFGGGTLKHNFVVRDFGGGTDTVGNFQKGGIAPFNEFDMPNVQVAQTVKNGATVIAYCDLYASEKHYVTEVTVIAQSGALLNLGSSGYITAKHNGATGNASPKLSLSTYGVISIGSLKLKIPFLMSDITVDMADVYCPISYIIDLHIFGDLSTSNRFKLLPGAHVTAEKGGSLILQSGAGLTVYTGDWIDQLSHDSSGNPVTAPYGIVVYPSGKGDAALLVEGSLRVETDAAIAGAVLGKEDAYVSIQSGVTTQITTKQGFSKSGSLGALTQVWVETARITKTAQLKAADNSLINLQADKNYVYKGGEWIIS